MFVRESRSTHGWEPVVYYSVSKNYLYCRRLANMINAKDLHLHVA